MSNTNTATRKCRSKLCWMDITLHWLEYWEKFYFWGKRTISCRKSWKSGKESSDSTSLLQAVKRDCCNEVTACNVVTVLIFSRHSNMKKKFREIVWESSDSKLIGTKKSRKKSDRTGTSYISMLQLEESGVSSILWRGKKNFCWKYMIQITQHLSTRSSRKRQKRNITL